MKICHLTSVHPRYDIRIFFKECRSLAEAGYETALIVADGHGDELSEGVRIYDVGAPKGRIDRVRRITRCVFEKAISLDAVIYHFHDPELIPVGLKLKRLGKRVIFDSHEDVPKQLLGKAYLNSLSRWILSKGVAVYELWSCRQLDGIVAATPYIREKFFKINAKVIDINNFPMLGELASDEIDWSAKRGLVAYVGGIARIRGNLEIVRAMGLTRTQVRLGLGGVCSEPNFKQELKAEEGWRFVDELGFLDRNGVRELLRYSVAGLVTLRPVVNYLDALPIKMFEYMSAGIPVIASNFPLWREIIEGNDCGLCVDPLNPREIAEAIDFFAENPGRAREMGKNGQRAVNSHYNWGAEKEKLLNFYEALLSSPD